MSENAEPIVALIKRSEIKGLQHLSWFDTAVIASPEVPAFFTVNLENRRSQWLTSQIDDLRSCYGHIQNQHPFKKEAIVILPDHMHCIWTLPPDDADYSTRWRLIKTAFKRRLKKSGIDIRKNHLGEHDL